MVAASVWGMCLRTSLPQFGEPRPDLWCPCVCLLPKTDQYLGTWFQIWVQPKFWEFILLFWGSSFLFIKISGLDRWSVKYSLSVITVNLFWNVSECNMSFSWKIQNWEEVDPGGSLAQHGDNGLSPSCQTLVPSQWLSSEGHFWNTGQAPLTLCQLQIAHSTLDTFH